MTPDPADPALVRRLVGWARRIGGDPACGRVVVLSHRTGELVVRAGDLVVKAHGRPVPPARLLLAGRLGTVFVPPVAATVLGGRAVTLWPAGTPLREADLAAAAPWIHAGVVLADLHRVPVPAGFPAAGAPHRVRRSVTRLDASPAAAGPRARAVRAALLTVPPWMRGEAVAEPRDDRPRTLVHGDVHLGQFVRDGARLRLIDVDDVGVGDPAWDLARMAAWYAAGVIPPACWESFLAAYRVAGGPAVPATGDPWPVLDPFARALTAQTAALAICNGDLDTAETFVAACRRIGSAGGAGG